MRLFLLSATTLLISAFGSGCGPNIDLASCRQELLEHSQRMRTAHLDGDVETILTSLAYPYTKIRNGEVWQPTESEDRQNFQNYLGSMDILRWDDLTDPIIVLSNDGSLATMTVRKHLVMVSRTSVDAEAAIEGIFAWQSTYRRTPEGWKQISDALTSLPQEELASELESLSR
jgi:hypothetical protein